MKYFWGLDLIRFLSAVLVVLFHVSAFGADQPSWPVDATDAPFGWLEPFAWWGWIGVQIFFVISGFVIAASARVSSAGIFLKKRAIRLLPALWLSASLALLVRVLWGEPLGTIFPAYLLTLVLSPKGPYIDGVVWTLVVEAAFYISVAIVVFLSPRIGGKEAALNKFAVLLGGMSSVFTLLYWGVHSNQGIISETLPAAFLDSFIFDVMLLRQGIFFALGMLIFQAVERDTPLRSSPLIVALSLVCTLQIYNNVANLNDALVPISVWAFATLLIYYGAKYGDRLVTHDVRPVMRPIGLMTYPLYLNHFVLGQALLPLMATWISSSIALFAALLSLLLANAWIIARYPEPWIQRRLRDVLLRKEPARLKTDQAATV